MENNLLQNIKSYFNENVITKLSGNLGESEEHVRKGIEVAIPSLLLGLQSRSTEGLSSIFTQAKHLFSRFDVDNILAPFFGGTGEGDNKQFESVNLVTSIFGDKADGIITTISGFLGLNTELVTRLFGAVVPAVISGVTHKGADWDIHSISHLLNANRSSFASALPSGLGLAAFGSAFANAQSPVEIEAPKNPVDVTPGVPASGEDAVTWADSRAMETKKGAGFWWLLIPLVLLVLWFLFGKKCQRDDLVAPIDTVAAVLDTITPVEVHDTLEVGVGFIDVKLPNEKVIKGYPSGMESKLLAFLQSGDFSAMSDEELKEQWFDFDNLNFEVGTSKLTAASQLQLDNLAAILTLFPEAKVKIGGYTDKTGDEVINVKVSQARADVVKKYLEREGLSGQVVGAEGYGSAFAKIPETASDEERSQDRRVAISVRR